MIFVAESFMPDFMVYGSCNENIRIKEDFDTQKVGPAIPIYHSYGDI